MLAAAAALCVSNRNVVRDMFIDNGDDTYGVRFFGSDGNQIWVTVDNQIPYNMIMVKTPDTWQVEITLGTLTRITCGLHCSKKPTPRQ